MQPIGQEGVTVEFRIAVNHGAQIFVFAGGAVQHGGQLGFFVKGHAVLGLLLFRKQRGNGSSRAPATAR